MVQIRHLPQRDSAAHRLPVPLRPSPPYPCQASWRAATRFPAYGRTERHPQILTTSVPDLVRRQGLEPRTCWLRASYSAIELAARRALDRNRTGIRCLEGSNTSHCVTKAGPGAVPCQSLYFAGLRPAHQGDGTVERCPGRHEARPCARPGFTGRDVTPLVSPGCRVPGFPGVMPLWSGPGSNRRPLAFQASAHTG